MPLNMTWTWQSKSPGRSVLPVTSTRSSPSRFDPTSTNRPPSTTTSTSAGGDPVPSNTLPPPNTVRVTWHLLTVVETEGYPGPLSHARRRLSPDHGGAPGTVCPEGRSDRTARPGRRAVRHHREAGRRAV